MTKAECRNKLLEVGTQLFAERGLHGVSIRELSQCADASISMISYYFGGKEGLYSAVLTEQFACFDEIEEIRQQGTDPVAMIAAYLRWTLQRHRNNPYLLRFYTSELTNPTPYFHSIVSPAIGKVIKILAEIVEDGIRQGRFRKDVNAVNAVVALAGMVNYYVLSTLATEHLLTNSPDRDEQLIHQYLAIFMGGIMSAESQAEITAASGSADE